MASLTIQLDDDLLRAARSRAAQEGVTVSQMVRDHLETVTGYRTSPPSDDDPLARFSRGELSRLEAMRALEVDYGTLLCRLAERRLPLPSLPAETVDRMADEFVRIWSAARED